MSGRQVSLAEIAELGARTLSSSADEIAAVAELVQRTTGIDITVVSEMTADGRYVFRGLEKRPFLPVERDAAIPYDVEPVLADPRRRVAEHGARHARGAGALGAVAAAQGGARRRLGHPRVLHARRPCCPTATRFGTLCLHHLEPRAFSADEQALLEVLARMLGLELWRERVGAGAARRRSPRSTTPSGRRVELADELQHELRAPLQVIDGYAEGMLDGVVSRDDEHVTLVRREAGRAIQLLDDLADARPHRGRRGRRGRGARCASTRSPPRCATASRRSPSRPGSSSSPTSRPPRS